MNLFTPVEFLGRMMDPYRGMPPKSPQGQRYATFNRRMLAATIDSLIMMLLLAPICDMLVTLVYGPVTISWADLQNEVAQQASQEEAKATMVRLLKDGGYVLHLSANIVFQTIGLCMFSYFCWARYSATPGKLLLGMRIVDADTGARMTSGQALVRLIVYFISGFGMMLGFIWILFDKERQAWHDKAANTHVVVDRPLDIKKWFKQKGD